MISTHKMMLYGLFFIVCCGMAFSQAPATPPVQLPKGNQPLGPKPIETYKEVLAQVPADLRHAKASAWTQAQRETANAAFKQMLMESKSPAKFRLKVSEIAAWSGEGFMTLFSEIPNQEGYHVRVFGKFSDDWKPKLTTLKKGDIVVLEGVLSLVTFGDVWGQFTLSIGLEGCTFTK